MWLLIHVWITIKPSYQKGSLVGIVRVGIILEPLPYTVTATGVIIAIVSAKQLK